MIDGVSCYANSALQCVFNCTALKQQLLKVPKTNSLRIAFDNYKCSNKKVDVMAVRKFADAKYAAQQQQDVVEFMNHLFNKVDNIRGVVGHTIRYTTTCLNKQCKNKITNNEPNVILSLPVDLAATKAVTLQQLLDEAFKTKDAKNEKCVKCYHDKITHKWEVVSAGPILIVQLMTFQWNKEKMAVQKITKCNIKAVHTEKLQIRNEHYKLISAIFHKGLTPYSGHYTTMLQEINKEKSSWYLLNDERVDKQSWPRSANGAYVLFLERQEK